MLEALKKSLGFYRWLLDTKFRQDCQEAVEILLMLVLGHAFGYYNPNQLADRLGLPKTRLYQELKSWSLYQWRRQLMLIGCEYAVDRLQELQAKSAATQSRMRVTISVDDTVVDRYGKVLSLTYSWWSGRHKKVVQGQNLLGITLKIGHEVIPLVIRPIGKQGCSNTSKPEVFQTLLKELLDYFEQHGLQLTQYPCTFDSWYGSYELVQLLQELNFSMEEDHSQEDKTGFDQILIHAKSCYVFTIGKVHQSLQEHKQQIQLEQGQWGCGDSPVARCHAQSPTFGKLVLLFFRHQGQVKALMVFGRPLRACEILSIWHQHHGIEQFWRSLKSVLQLGSMHLRGRAGVYAELGIKLMAYVMMLRVSRQCHLTLSQLQMQVRKQLDMDHFFREHFHPGHGAAATSTLN